MHHVLHIIAVICKIEGGLEFVLMNNKGYQHCKGIVVPIDKATKRN